MKAYYAVGQIGDGKSEPTSFRPDLPTGYSGWVVCTEAPVQPPSPQTWVILVSADAAYYAALKTNPDVLWLADVEEAPDA